MSRSLLLILVVCSVTLLWADEPKKLSPLAEAKQRLQRGNHAEARQLFEELLQKPEHRTPARIGLAKTYEREGQYTKALQILEAGLKDDPQNGDWLAKRADLLYQTGQWEEALTAAETVLKTKKDHLPARWVKAQILRDSGEFGLADAEMRWFVRHYTTRSNKDQDITDPEELLIIGLAGTENARWHQLNDQFRFILNDVYPDARKADPNCWEAEYLSGMMFLEKFNKPDALASFDDVLKTNPNAAEALVGKGLVAMIGMEYREAERFADQALKINPNLTDALRLKADVHLASGEINEALHLLEKAKKVNPREESTLARIAAGHHIRGRNGDFKQIVAEVEKFCKKPALFYFELGNCLEDRRFYADAETFYKTSIGLWDKLAAPRTGLGLLYLRMGREAEAKDLLAKAFEKDRFDVRVANSLKVLRHLDTYKTLQTPHYEIRYDPKTDEVLAGFLADYLEEVHADLVQQFQYEPKERFLFELFNSHEMFSGRTIALPDLHTIGACTGRVVTMVSPKGKGVRKPFNWGRVIRHELVHIFNLDQTHFRVPHWLTEGLAVRNERLARPPSWNQILRERFEQGTLLSLDTIQLGFARPRTPAEWSLAYCQSQLYVDYLTQTHGPESVSGLLNAYRQGLEDAAAIQQVCKVDKAEFEKGYLAFVTEIVKTIPKSRRVEAKEMTLDELKEANQKTPEDLEVASRLADQYVRRGMPAEARKLVDGILMKQPGHPSASIVKARLLSQAGDDEAARAIMESAYKAHAEEPRILILLGRMYQDAKEYKKAAEVLEQGRKVAPLDGPWLDVLSEIYEAVKQSDKQIEVLEQIAKNDADDLNTRLKLAELLLDAKKYTDAEKYAKEALMIDVLNLDVRNALLKSLREQGKNDEIEKLNHRFKER